GEGGGGGGGVFWGGRGGGGAGCPHTIRARRERANPAKGPMLLPSERNETRRFVQAAGAERLEVERNELEPCRLERLHGLPSDLDQAGELAVGHLDARDLAVVPHAELAEPQRTEGHFASRELPEAFRCDFSAVRDPRRQAGLLRLVPCRQAHLAAQLADLGLGQAGLGERL